MVVVVGNKMEWVVVARVVGLVGVEMQTLECSNLMENQWKEGRVVVELGWRCSSLKDPELGRGIEADGEVGID